MITTSVLILVAVSAIAAHYAASRSGGWLVGTVRALYALAHWVGCIAHGADAFACRYQEMRRDLPQIACAPSNLPGASPVTE